MARCGRAWETVRVGAGTPIPGQAAGAAGWWADKSFLRTFFAFCERSGDRSGGFRHGPSSPVKLRVVDLAKLDGGAQEAKAAGGHPPAPRTGDLGHQSIGMEAREEAADLTGLLGCLGVEWEAEVSQLLAEIAVGEAVDEVFSGEQGLEQSPVGLGQGVERLGGST